MASSGVVEQHEFAVGAFDSYLAKAVELADAMIHVDDKISRLEIGEIAEEAGGFWAGAGALGGRRERFEEIGVAVDSEIYFGNHCAFADGRFDQDHAGNIAAVRLFSEAADRGIFFDSPRR